MHVEPMFAICHVGCHKGWKLGHLGPNLYWSLGGTEDPPHNHDVPVTLVSISAM
jgi:hypothetical protein